MDDPTVPINSVKRSYEIIDEIRDREQAGVTELADALERTDPDLTEKAGKTACREALDDHEVPRVIEFVDGIPWTPTGKIDRIDLRNSF